MARAGGCAEPGFFAADFLTKTGASLGLPLWRRNAYSQNFAFHPQMQGFARLASRLMLLVFASPTKLAGREVTTRL